MGSTASEEVLRSREKLPNQTSLGLDAGSCFLGARVRGGLFGLEDEPKLCNEEITVSQLW